MEELYLSKTYILQSKVTCSGIATVYAVVQQ